MEKLKALVKSSTVTPDKLHQWLDKGLPAGQVFKNMKLDQPNVFSLFYNPSFVKWVQYADDLSAKSPSKASSVISTLTSLYGDKVVYEVIYAAKKYPNLRELASRLQEDQLRYWIAIRKDSSVFFDLLNLNLRWTGTTTLTKQEFAVWLKYVDDVNARHPEAAPLSIIPTLAQSLGRTGRDGNVELVKIIDAGKDNFKSEAVAKRMESELFDFWLRRQETPDKIMNMLKHDTPTSAFLGSPRWKEWEKYLNVYNARFPEKKTTAIETYVGKHGGVNLVAQLAKAM
ncbi:hypothetical protein PInf_006393 [Phytophthora infestans]|nr:hypothetical protein PInf_006393 [Phytophthora infestans]